MQQKAPARDTGSALGTSNNATPVNILTYGNLDKRHLQNIGSLSNGVSQQTFQQVPLPTRQPTSLSSLAQLRVAYQRSEPSNSAPNDRASQQELSPVFTNHMVAQDLGAQGQGGGSPTLL